MLAEKVLAEALAVHDAQVEGIEESQELLLVRHLAEVYCGEILYRWFDDLHEPILVLVHSEEENDSAILSEKFLGLEQSFFGAWHQHKRENQDNKVEFLVGDHATEVLLPYLHIRVLLE